MRTNEVPEGTTDGNPISHEEIARLSYARYLELGMRHGHHVEDWLKAEREIEEIVDGLRMAEAA